MDPYIIFSFWLYWSLWKDSNAVNNWYLHAVRIQLDCTGPKYVFGLSKNITKIRSVETLGLNWQFRSRYTSFPKLNCRWHFHSVNFPKIVKLTIDYDLQIGFGSKQWFILSTINMFNSGSRVIRSKYAHRSAFPLCYWKAMIFQAAYWLVEDRERSCILNLKLS